MSDPMRRSPAWRPQECAAPTGFAAGRSRSGHSSLLWRRTFGAHPQHVRLGPAGQGVTRGQRPFIGLGVQRLPAHSPVGRRRSLWPLDDRGACASGPLGGRPLRRGSAGRAHCSQGADDQQRQQHPVTDHGRSRPLRPWPSVTLCADGGRPHATNVRAGDFGFLALRLSNNLVDVDSGRC